MRSERSRRSEPCSSIGRTPSVCARTASTSSSSRRRCVPADTGVELSSAQAEPERLAVSFASILRGAGVVVPLGSVLAYADALAAVGVRDRSSVYWAGRATLVRQPEDVATYDRAFAVFWEQVSSEPGALVIEQPIQLTLAVEDEDDERPQAEDEQERAETP